MTPMTPETTAQILDRLGINGFDKPFGTDKDTIHSYGPVYDRVAARIRGTVDLRVLEIGVQHGGSLLLWGALFPEAGLVLGVDIALPPEGFFARAQDRYPVAFRQMDAYTESARDQLVPVGPFDLIIDDGPHTPQSQVDFVRLYAPLVAPGGVLVVEDIEHWSDFEGLLPPDFTSERIDRREVKGRYDDRLFVAYRDPA